MPYAVNKGVRIYWEERGSGDPVLMIIGLTFSLDMWHRTAPVLERTHRLLMFDNRGVGRSDVPKGVYRMRSMAEDARAVLDAAGVESADILGASMGGMIAQELALRHPERVRSLLLACTSCGGLRSKLPRIRGLGGKEKWDVSTPEERIRGWNPLLYAEGTDPDRIEEDNQIRLQWTPSMRGYAGQLLAILRWSSYRRLPRINVPTMIVHGESDYLIPVENARILARRIPNSVSHVLPNAGHILTTDQPDAAHQLLIEFLKRRSQTSVAADGH